MGAWRCSAFFARRAGDLLGIPGQYRDAKATEEISVTHSELRVRRVSHRGHVVEWVLNPFVGTTRPESPCRIRHRAALSGLPRPPRLIASFLGPDEKASFAKLNAALQPPGAGDL